MRLETDAPGLPDDIVVLDYPAMSLQNLPGLHNQKIVFVSSTVKLNQVTLFDNQVSPLTRFSGHHLLREDRSDSI